ncbi:hypothetical protein STCU_10370 [Strigomonas culicis]|uniref:Uncharacterized protein n=1 Tax=Strigomonas culicis TaxID=28005 RepID=S9TN74_9TRYP|nr:hypothetical protein STCU_10370 [Strigomonas culicis]|eukprot:EPY17833.1 hypothetical protein STCU_10370 [Strigomonas culicis]
MGPVRGRVVAGLLERRKPRRRQQVLQRLLAGGAPRGGGRGRSAAWPPRLLPIDSAEATRERPRLGGVGAPTVGCETCRMEE